MNRHMYARQQEKNYLAHHGILGQKWGIRRYQNEDGTLTEEGKKRYSNNQKGHANQYYDYYQNAKKEYLNEKGGKSGYKQFYKDTYIPAMKKMGYEDRIMKPNDLVDAVVTGRLKNAYINDYGGTDEFNRDRYAKMTHDAIRNNAIWATVATAAASGGAQNNGYGWAPMKYEPVKDKRIEYEKYEQKINSKNEKIDEYIKEYDNLGGSGWYQKVKKDENGNFKQSISFNGKDIEKKAKEARFVEKKYETLKNEWNNAIKNSGSLNEFNLKEKEKKRILSNGPTRIYIDSDKIDGHEYDYAYAVYQDNLLDNTQIEVEYDLNNMRVKNVLVNY